MKLLNDMDVIRLFQPHIIRIVTYDFPAFPGVEEQSGPDEFPDGGHILIEDQTDDVLFRVNECVIQFIDPRKVLYDIVWEMDPLFRGVCQDVEQRRLRHDFIIDGEIEMSSVGVIRPDNQM